MKITHNTNIVCFKKEKKNIVCFKKKKRKEQQQQEEPPKKKTHTKTPNRQCRTRVFFFFLSRYWALSERCKSCCDVYLKGDHCQCPGCIQCYLSVTEFHLKLYGCLCTCKLYTFTLLYSNLYTNISSLEHFLLVSVTLNHI